MSDNNESVQSESEVEQYEELKDEIYEKSFESYCAGFAQAIETFDIDTNAGTDVPSLMNHELLGEAHWYYWDGKTWALEHYLKDEFDIGADMEEVDVDV